MLRDTLHYLNYKDKKLRKLFYRKELKLLLLKSSFFDIRIKYSCRFLLKNKSFSPLATLNTRIKSRCLHSGRNRFIFKYFRLNRASLKHYSSFGYISGFQKW